MPVYIRVYNKGISNDNQNNMEHINIKATNIELTQALREYVEKRFESVSKFIKQGSNATVYVEIGKSTNHHKQGDYFIAEINLAMDGETYRISREQSDLYAAIDEAKDELIQEITTFRDKKQTLWKRGARSVKKMLKGISNRNPFTSKY